MPYVDETSEERSKRIRNGRIVATVSVAWWIISIGGIIYVINTTG